MAAEPHTQVFAFAQRAQTLGIALLEQDPIRRLSRVWDVLLAAPDYEADEDGVVLALILSRIAKAFVAGPEPMPLSIAARTERSRIGDLHVTRALESISRHYANPALGLRSLAAECRLSPSHLSEILHFVTGHGVRTHLSGTRLLHSAHGLVVSALSVQEIAAICGFSSTAGLDREFHKWFNMSPGQFRRWAL